MDDIYSVLVPDLSITSTPKSGRQYFPMLLTHAAMRGSDIREEGLRDEVCRLLFMALSTDTECFARWEEVYPRFIPQSNNLLLYILLQWRTLSGQVRNMILREEYLHLFNFFRLTIIY